MTTFGSGPCNSHFRIQAPGPHRSVDRPIKPEPGIRVNRYERSPSLLAPMHHHSAPSIRFLAIAALLALNVSAQNLPDEYHVSDDGLRLVAGDLPVDGLYSVDGIKVIHLTFNQPDFWTLLDQSHQTGVHILASLEYDGQVFDSVGVRIKGQTSYMMLPPGSQKFSFDINMEEFVDGQDLGGYETVNLNNGFQDPSVMRDVIYHHLLRPHVPAARACFAQLFINGQNWGHYSLVQDLDSDFIREWWWSNDGSRWRADRPDGDVFGGQWGDGTAGLNYLGPDTADYQEYYTLGRSEQENPWDALVTVCDKLNNTPIAQLNDTLDKYMDIDRVLWHLAGENAFGDDDSYIHKGKMDYSLYWDPETGRMTTQELDGNSILGTESLNWSPFYHANNVNYPLLNRVLQVPELRQRYLAHLRHIIATSMQQADVAALIAQYRSLIDTVVQDDPIKLMTWSQYQSSCTTLGNRFNTRRNALNNNTEVAQQAPTIGNVEHETGAGIGQPPVANETVHVRATVSSTNGINRVGLYWSNVLPGRFSRMDMHDDGAHNDGSAGDGVFGADIPGQPGGFWVRYYVAAEADNTAHSTAFSPPGAEHDVWIYQVTPTVSPTEGVVINELMASNSSTVMDNNDQYEDWVELYNHGSAPVDLEGWFLTDTPFEPTKWEFPGGTVLAPGMYMIVWPDEDQSQGLMHANFKLSASGESVLLYDPDTLLADQVDFGQQITDMGYARVPNGTGPFVIQAPTFAASNDVTGFDEVAPNAGFRMYPNPASTHVILVWDGAGTHTVTIHDATGRLVRNLILNSGSILETSTFGPGTYTVRCAQATQRLVVVR